MSGWDSTASAGVDDTWSSSNAQGWNAGANADGFNGTGTNNFNEGFDGDGFGNQGDNEAGAGAHGACHNCGQEGHLARECPVPRKLGACFNCGQDGHSKADCPNPRVFQGECRTCGQAGHPAADCPNRVITCRQCLQEGHETIDCKKLKVLDLSKVPEKSEDEAWTLLKEASDDRDITDFKDAVKILSKVCPTMTYQDMEKAFRKREFKVFLIAMEKDHGDTLTVVNLQGEVEKKYTVSYFLTAKAQRPNMAERWPKTPEENMERLADAGVPMDRGVEKCGNCDQLGHTARRCAEEKRVPEDRAIVKCALCDQEGHRVRDCTQERRQPGAPKTCKICESEDHIAKECPNREKRTCRNCGSEDHMAKECTEPRNPDTMQCRNCDRTGHMSKECPMPRDWSRVTCRRCGEKGHTPVRCKLPAPEEDGAGAGVGDENTGAGFDDGAASGGGDWNAGNNPVDSGHNDWEVSNPDPIAANASGGW